MYRSIYWKSIRNEACILKVHSLLSWIQRHRLLNAVFKALTCYITAGVVKWYDKHVILYTYICLDLSTTIWSGRSKGLYRSGLTQGFTTCVADWENPLMCFIAQYKVNRTEFKELCVIKLGCWKCVTNTMRRVLNCKKIECNVLPGSAAMFTEDMLSSVTSNPLYRIQSVLSSHCSRLC